MEIRHYFAGGNTPAGFYSFYDEVLPVESAKRRIYFKGGPGTGKSSFMKRLGATLAERGQAVEFLHCSGDPVSLDGVVSRESGFLVVDATAPHMQDPKLLGAADELFDPGRFLDAERVRPYRDRLLMLGRLKTENYARAYRYLSMAGTLLSGIYETVASALFYNAVIYESEVFVKELFSNRPIPPTAGVCRHAFATAVTPNGITGYLETLFSPYTIYFVQCEKGVGADIFLSRVSDAAVSRGVSVEAYCSPFDPRKIEHLVLPELGIALTTASEVEAQHTIDLFSCFDRTQLGKVERRVKQDQQLLDLLLERTFGALREAKEEHGKMEEILTPAMDFNAMEDEFSRIIQGI